MARRRAILFLVAVAVFCVWLWTPQHRPVGDPPQAIPLNVVTAQHLTTIRVKLTSNPAAEIELKVDGPFRIQPIGDSRLLGEAANLKSTKVSATRTGFQIGPEHYAVTRLEILPRNSPAVWVNGHSYRGSILLYRRPGGKLTAINVLPLEEYIACVTDSEMPAAFPLEARKAQAVVARTYAIYQIGKSSRDSLFDVHADTRSQKYQGYQYPGSDGRLLAGESAAAREVARQTRGMVCTFRGKVFCTYYSAVCGGGTLQGSELFADAVPALTSVVCADCREAKYYRWEATLSRTKLESLLKSASLAPSALGPLVSMQEIPNTPVGRLKTYDVRFQKGKRQMRSDELRTALAPEGARSPHFSVEHSGEQFNFHGRGHGHGVGLCQWGARGAALRGRNFQQILQHYYPGTDLVVATSSLVQN